MYMTSTTLCVFPIPFLSGTASSASACSRGRDYFEKSCGVVFIGKRHSCEPNFSFELGGVIDIRGSELVARRAIIGGMDLSNFHTSIISIVDL